MKMGAQTGALLAKAGPKNSIVYSLPPSAQCPAVSRRCPDTVVHLCPSVPVPIEARDAGHRISEVESDRF